MSAHSFTISLNPLVKVTVSEDQYTLQETKLSSQTPTDLLTLATTSGISWLLDSLKAGNTTMETLVQTLAQREDSTAIEQLALTLQQLDERGWLSYAVLPLAVAIPMVDSAELNLTTPHWTQTGVTLSRFAYQHPYEGTMVLESPLSKFRVKLLDWRASAILAQLAQPQSLATLTPPPYLGPETAYQFLNLLWATGFLTTDPEPSSLQLWDFHNLLFHSRSRLGRHDYPAQDVDVEQWSDFPVVKPPMSDRLVPLPRPNLGALMCNDATLTEAIETRRSIRQYDDANPITVEQLSELLYRTARVKDTYQVEEWFGENWRDLLGFDADIDYGELGIRPYPSAGAMYELEIYPIVRLCQGLNTGLYHYDALNHQLERIVEAEDNIFTVSGYDVLDNLPGDLRGPQVLLVMTARFGRLFRKYRSIAYSLAACFPLPIKYESRRRHIQRFLTLFSLSLPLFWFPIIKMLIDKEFADGSRLIITIDRTQWKEQNIFVIGVIYKKRALPIYWQILEKKGSSNLGEQKAIIKPVLRLLKKYELVVIGDREFHGVELSHWLKNQKSPEKIYFVFRQKQNTYYRKPGKNYEQLSSLPIYPGTKIFLSHINITQNKGFGKFNLAAYWKGKYNQKVEKEPWYLLTNLNDLDEV